MRILFLVILGSFLLSACGSQSAPPNQPAAEFARWSGPNGGGDMPATRVLRTAEEWAAFWRQVERSTPQPLDVSRQMAVIVALGERRTGGFSVEIESAHATDGNLVVTYREKAPDPSMMVTQALTTPWAAALVSRSDLPVVFRKAGGAPSTTRQKN